MYLCQILCQISAKTYILQCSSESLDGMSIKPEKINSAKSLNAWPSTECRKNKMAAENNMVTVETGNSMAARRSMPNLGRGNYSKSSSYDAAFCNCHLYSLKGFELFYILNVLKEILLTLSWCFIVYSKE